MMSASPRSRQQPATSPWWSSILEEGTGIILGSQKWVIDKT
jgi:hypothetical protein